MMRHLISIKNWQRTVLNQNEYSRIHLNLKLNDKNLLFWVKSTENWALYFWPSDVTRYGLRRPGSF